MSLLKISLLVLVLNVFSIGQVFAETTNIEEQANYSRSLNSMAARLMTWYGSLITHTKPLGFQQTNERWQQYRKHYPNDIRHIQILKTNLIKSPEDNRYQFKVSTAITHGKEKQLEIKKVDEEFVFHLTQDSYPIIEKINRSVNEENISEPKQTIQTGEFGVMYFKSREFAYAWLAYLDGAESASSITQSDNWLDTAPYTIKIGSENINSSVKDSIKDRKQFLAKGGHTLRLIDVAKKENNDTYVLNLTMNWKGVNNKGKPVIAKITQQIEFQIKGDNSWHVLSIDEQHLLPDLKPWQNFLC